MNKTQKPGAKPKGRAAAGQDPVKRDQILDGAKNCFLKLGFEAASMNEITAEAGVSKGTIYVYFQNKDELFSALIRREREKLLSLAEYDLLHAPSVREALTGFGVALATRLSSDEVVRAQRMVLAVADRMPQVAADFFGPEPFSGVAILQRFLDARVAAGELKIANTDLAARQLIELATAMSFKRRLFGTVNSPLPAETVRLAVDSGVDMFLAYYAR